MMLGIKVNGEWLSLYPKQKVTLKLRSPLFVYEPVAQSRSLPFNIPVTGNAWILAHFNEPDNRNKVITFECELWLSNNFWCAAKLDITSATEKDFKVQLRLAKGILGDYADRSLRSFEYKNPVRIRTFFEAYMKLKYEFSFLVADPTDFSMEWTVIGSRGTKSFNVTYQAGWSIDQLLNYMKNMVNDAFEETNVVAEVRGGFLYIYDIYNWGSDTQAVEDNISSLTEVFFVRTTDNPFPYAGFNNTNAHVKEVNESTPGDYDYAFVPVKNPNYFGEENTNVPTAIKEYINRYNPGALGDVTTTIDKLQPTTPFPYLYNLVRLLYEEQGVEIVNRFFDAELKTLLLYSNFEGNHISVTQDSAGVFLYNTKTFFKYADTLPLISVKDFMGRWSNTFCVVQNLDYSGRMVTIISRKDVLQTTQYDEWSNVVDKNIEITPDQLLIKLAFDNDDTDQLTGELIKEIDSERLLDAVLKSSLLPTTDNVEGDLRLVKIDNGIYQVQPNPITANSDTWVQVAQALQDYSPTAAAKTSILCAGSLCMLLENCPTVDASHKWLIPHVKQTGRSRFYKSPNEEEKLRLIFYRGMHRTITSAYAYTSNYYPLAQAHRYDAAGNTTGNYSLSFTGTGGIYETWWKDWMAYVAKAERCKAKGIISQEKLMTLDFLVPKKVGNQQYFIDEISVAIGDTIDPAEIIMYRR